MQEMKTLSEIKAFFEGDKFLSHVGIEIESVKECEAVCSVVLNQNHYNANGGVQGGVIYTLADTAFAVSANSTGNSTVTLDGSIRYINGTRGAKLLATAKLLRMSKKICFYEVVITDDLNVTVATCNFTGYIHIQ
jgi:acyl-CoA thioesterase